jgi:hypothetical protein
VAASPRFARRLALHRVLPLVLATLLLAACNTHTVQSRREFFLNPDGSGKVLLNVRFRESDDAGHTLPRSRGEVVKRFAEDFAQCTGVDAIAALQLEAEPEGWQRVRATVYFRDLAALELGSLTAVTFRYRLAPAPGGARLEATYAPLQSFLQTTTDELRRAAQEGSADPWIADRRKEYERDPAERFLRDNRFEEILHLPGAVQGAVGLERAGPRTLRIRLANEPLRVAWRDVYAESALRRMRAAGSGEPLRGSVMRTLFGTEGPLGAAVAGPLAPLFDYEQEAAPARAAQAALFSRLGIEADKAPKR